MERAKRRWFVALGALLAFGAIVLLGRQYVPSETEAVPVTVNAPSSRPAEEQPVPPTAELSAPSTAAATASATGGDLRGRIIDAVTRLPIREFEVRLTRVQGSEYLRDEDPIVRTFQSESGRFEWSDVAPDRWKMAVAAHGYQQFDGGKVAIVAGRTTPGIVMPLRRGYTVRGRVFERSTGAGIVGATVAFWSASAHHRRQEAKSKDDGSFGEVVLSVSEPEHAPRSVDVVVDDKTPPQEIALSTGATVAGVVTSIAGSPVKGSVSLGALGVGYADSSDEAGRFIFKHLPPGEYTVVARTTAGSAMLDFVLGQDERKDDIVLTVGAGRSVRGTIKGLRSGQRAHANPTAATSIDFDAEVDEQGAYVFHGVPPGQAMLSAWNGGRRINRVIDVPAEQDLVVDVVFPPGLRLSGRVTQGGQPAADRNIWIAPADSAFAREYPVSTSQDGRYEIDGVLAGDYRITAEEDIARSITIASDTVLNIDIPSVQLAGRVVATSGEPIVGAAVFVRDNELEMTPVLHSTKETDDFGRFTLTGIAPGEIELTLFKPGYELYREKLAYSSPIRDKAITLRSGRGVEVRVRRSVSDGDGLRMRRLIVVERADSGQQIVLQIPVDRDGIAYLPSGLAGSRLVMFGNRSGRPTIIDRWDGSPLDLTL